MLLPSRTLNGSEGSAVNAGRNSAKQKINVIQALGKFYQRKLTDRDSRFVMLAFHAKRNFSLNTSVVYTQQQQQQQVYSNCKITLVTN